jgi:hypothetical protein
MDRCPASVSMAVSPHPRMQTTAISGPSTPRLKSPIAVSPCLRQIQNGLRPSDLLVLRQLADVLTPGAHSRHPQRRWTDPGPSPGVNQCSELGHIGLRQQLR